MRDFMTAYVKRCERVQAELKELAEELKASGCVVYGGRSGFLSFLKVYKDGKSLVYGFESVPYHWYIDNEVDPRLKNGSYKKAMKSYDTNAHKAEEVLEYLGESFSFREDLEQLDKKNWYLNRL